MDIQKQNRIRPPRHRWSHEVWEATAPAELLAPNLPSADGRLPVILKTCNWGDSTSPFDQMRRTFLRRESVALDWMEHHAPDIAPRKLFYDEEQLVMERFTGPDFFSDRNALIDNRQVWERLNKTVHRMHEGGLAHGELRLGNLIYHNDEVRLVDFATGCTKDSQFYKVLCWLDEMAIVWMKAHIFRLPLESDELRLQNNHKIFHQWFLKYIACDIPYA